MSGDQSRILITGNLHEKIMQKFFSLKNLKITYIPDCSRKALEKHIVSAQVLITRSETKVDAELLDKACELKIIARAAVGIANIDVEYASKKGILVLNTPGKNTNSAAELSFALLLAMFRKIPQAFNQVKNEAWDRHKFIGQELRGKRIGIVGLGHVGHRVAKFAHGFDMEVFAYDPYISPKMFARYHVTAFSDLKELAKNVDILSVHVPLNKETIGMVNHTILACLPKNSFVVNAARGGIIDEQAIIDHLDSGRLKGAAIDTWKGEPNLFRKLSNHPKVFCSPHIGASTEEASLAIGESIFDQVLKALEGAVVDYPVNLPQIGVIDNPLVKPYTILAEKLGRLAGQINKSNPSKIEVQYSGDLAGVDHALIRLGWMKGYVSCAVDSYVSYVNAQSHFEKLGLKITESENPDFASYRSAIKFVMHHEREEALCVGGIVFDQSYIRISLINDFDFEIEPSGIFLLVNNADKPGVVGELGMLLARERINIDSFDLSRKDQGGDAMAIIKIDSALSHDILEQISALPHVKNAQTFSL